MAGGQGLACLTGHATRYTFAKRKVNAIGDDMLVMHDLRTIMLIAKLPAYSRTGIADFVTGGLGFDPLRIGNGSGA